MTCYDLVLLLGTFGKEPQEPNLEGGHQAGARPRGLVLRVGSVEYWPLWLWMLVERWASLTLQLKDCPSDSMKIQLRQCARPDLSKYYWHKVAVRMLRRAWIPIESRMRLRAPEEDYLGLEQV